MTPTATRLKVRLDERTRWFADAWFFKWHFIGREGPVSIDAFDGSTIRLGGVQYDGAARALHWETLVRGIRREIIEPLAWVEAEVRACNRAAALAAIEESAGLLVSFVRRIRRHAVAEDRILRGNRRVFPSEDGHRPVGRCVGRRGRGADPCAQGCAARHGRAGPQAGARCAA